MSDSIETVSATLTLPITFPGATGQVEAFKLWSRIPANDQNGITIDNVMKGDEIHIYYASGIASFKDTNMKMVKSIVGIANAIAEDVLLYATEGEAAPFLLQWNKYYKEIGDAVGDSNIKHARRDQFGEDPGTGDFGKEEGGLIVCMPESKGTIYASDRFYFSSKAKSEGRKYEYYSDEAKRLNVLFPSNSAGGRTSATATIGGAVNVLAFDSKFTDNAGDYVVGILIIRGERPSGRTVKQLIERLSSVGPHSGSL